MGIHQPIRKTVAPEIPDKLYFRIGDVARLCEVPAYVLRFWETEFPQLKPNKGGTGQRLYRKRDVEMALRIKSLLYDQGYTIPGARQVFKNELKARETGGLESPERSNPGVAAPVAVAAPVPVEAPRAVEGTRAGQIEARLRSLRAEMEELVRMLGGTPSAGPSPVASSGPSAVPSPAASATGGPRPAPAPRSKAMRPQLVLEPRSPKPEPVRADRRQADLFPFE